MEERIYDFCPKCGALTLNGICQNCGHKEKVKVPRHSEENPVSHVHTADEWQKKENYSQADRDIDKGISDGAYGTERERKTSAGYKNPLVFVMAVVCVAVCFLMSAGTHFLVGGTREVLETFGRDSSEDGDDERAMADTDEAAPKIDSALNYDKDSAAADGQTSPDGLFDSSHQNHFGETFDGDYYEQFCDYIDESVDYSVNHGSYEYQNPELNVNVQVSYIQLESDTFDMTSVNDTLSYYAQYFKNIFEGGDEDQIIRFAHNEIVYDMFVTYNDAEKISTLTQMSFNYDGDPYYNDMICMNFDLVTGNELFADEMLDYNDEFVDDWIVASTMQNGSIGSSGFSRRDVKEYFNSEDCIAFFTPMGMEIGYYYHDPVSDSDGWITATFKDYEKYKNKL